MTYFKQKHSQIIISSFLISSILLMVFSEIDIQISKIFFNHGFYLLKTWWETLLHNTVPYFLSVSVAITIGVYFYNKFKRKNIFGIDGKKTLYLLLVLTIGAGIVVNTVFKIEFGRARPRDIIEFNGDKLFTPIFVVSHECSINCSFSSGEAAGAFFALAIAFLFKKRRRSLMIAILFGSLVSFSRIASGAHFFSDGVVSFFIMLITADVLYYYFFLHQYPKSIHEN